jgi:hypothetical protein
MLRGPTPALCFRPSRLQTLALPQSSQRRPWPDYDFVRTVRGTGVQRPVSTKLDSQFTDSETVTSSRDSITLIATIHPIDVESRPRQRLSVASQTCRAEDPITPAASWYTSRPQLQTGAPGSALQRASQCSTHWRSCSRTTWTRQTGMPLAWNATSAKAARPPQSSPGRFTASHQKSGHFVGPQHHRSLIHRGSGPDSRAAARAIARNHA